MSKQATPAVPADFKGVLQAPNLCSDLRISTSLGGVIICKERVSDLSVDCVEREISSQAGVGYTEYLPDQWQLEEDKRRG